MVAESTVLDPNGPEGSVHTCPISKETGTVPRRSVELNNSSSRRAPRGQQQQQKSASSLDEPAAWQPSAHWGSVQAGVTPAPTDVVQQQACGVVAAACRSRDVKQLQALLARHKEGATDAADASGNTALHLVLLPYSPPAHAPPADITTSTQRAASLSWLTGCFGAGGPPASLSQRAGSLSGPAALQAQHSMVVALLAAGADANARSKAGHTPLMLAVQQLVAMCTSAGSSSLVAPALRVLDLLCKHPLLEPNKKDDQGRTALAQLLQGQLGLASSSAPGQRHQQGSGPQSAHAAAAFAAVQLKAVQMLLHSGADCNAADKAGMTPLMFASAQPGVSRELLQLLLERGANTRQLDNSRRSALTHALLAHNLKLLPALGAAGSGSSSGELPCLTCSCSCSSTAKAAAAGVAGKDVQVCPARPAQQQQQQAAELIRAGAAPCSAASSACDSCTSPADLHAHVHTCSMYGSSAPPSTSVSGSSNVLGGNSNNGSGAVNPRHASVIRALCSYGALDLHPASINTRFPGLNSFSQLHIAMRRGDVMAVQMLLAGGADVNATDSWGNSPLMYWPVAPSEPAELVEELVGKLLSHGADPNLPNHDAWHALDLCCDLNKLGKVVVKPQHVPVHALLVGWGAKNSDAFRAQYRNPPQLLCMRTDSANDFIRNSKGFGSIRVISIEELAHQVAAIREDTSV